MLPVSPAPAQRVVELTIDGNPVRVPEGAQTLLEACRLQNVLTPTTVLLRESDSGQCLSGVCG